MEIEAKFQVSDERILDKLAQATELAGFPLGRPAKRTLSDVYLDTPGGLVAAAGYACRKRITKSRVLVTLKTVAQPEDDIHRREEYEVEISEAASWPEWPESRAREILEGIVGDEVLQEVLVIRQVRAVRRVGPPRRGVAELSLDRVEVDGGPAGTAQAGEEEKSVFYEVEAELRPHGTEEQLAAIALALREQWGLAPQPLSKLVQARRLLHPAQTETPTETSAEEAEPSSEVPVRREVKKGGRGAAKRKRFLGNGLPVLKKPGLGPHDTMAEAANKTLLFHLQQMMLHEPGTRKGEDPEELHDMRVATRRMRAAVRVFDDYVEAGALKPYLKMMRQTGRSLGTVRDLDVFHIKAQGYLDSLPPARRSELDPLLAAWEAERSRACGALVSFLDDDRYESFKESFERFLRSSGLSDKRRVSPAGEPVPVLVRDVLPQIVFERLAEVRAYDEEMMSGTAPVVRFHQLRITMKALRYTLEFFQEVLGPKVKPLIDTTKLVQDHLGDLQDASVTCEVLLAFLASGTWGKSRSKSTQVSPINAPGVATYLVEKQKEIDLLMRTFKPVWRKVRGPQFSRRLASLVGAL